jgi:hypothetical protein
MSHTNDFKKASSFKVANANNATRQQAVRYTRKEKIIRRKTATELHAQDGLEPAGEKRILELFFPKSF